jgi:calcium/calmodulin-dependent protein kinase I
MKSIKYIEFANIVEKKNSDIYFLIYMFLLKAKPFSYRSIELYQSNELKHSNTFYHIQTNNNLKYNRNNSNSFIGNKNSVTLSDINIKSNFGINKNSMYKSEANINQTNFNTNISMKKKLMGISFKDFKVFFKDNANTDSRRINFRNTETYKNYEMEFFNQDFDNTIFEALLPSELCDELETIQYNEEEFEDILNDDKTNIQNTLESESNNYQGYIYKLINEKMVKVWFKLFYKDLFYYKKKKEKTHRGMHNLSGLFLRREATKILNDIIYYSFSIIFPNKKRVYFCDDLKEYKNWIKHLRIATNYSNILKLYTITDKLGSGSFSEVKLAINKVTKQKVAVKIMNKKKMNSSRLESARTEIEIMKICQFPYIIKFIEAYENLDFIYIFMEYCPGGTLYDFIKRRNFNLSEQLSATIIYKMCLAIYYFHSYGIAHRDLKPENVLMTSEDDNADIRILDFGLGKIVGPNEKCSEPYGTVIYCAPEIIKNKPYTKNVDSWSLGIITYILLYGRLPYWDPEKPKLKLLIVKTVPVYKGITLPEISEEGINFIQNLLIKDPNKRMSIKQALEHKWFKKFNKNNLVKLESLDKDKKSIIEMYNL